MTEPTSIGSRIREEREWCGFTRAYVAQALGVTDDIVAALEDDRTSPTAEQVEKLNLLLGLAPGRLQGEPLRENLPVAPIACGPGPITQKDLAQMARFAEYLKYGAPRKEASDA